MSERGPTVEELEQRLRAVTYVVAGLLDAMKWHLRGAEGTDRDSLDKAQRAFVRDVLGKRE